MSVEHPNIARFAKRPGRLIVVRGKRWKWQVGSVNVVAHSEDGQRIVCPKHHREPVTPMAVAHWLKDVDTWTPIPS